MALPLVALTGQLAAGKSTVAVALSERYPRGYHIEIDALREMVTAGRASPLEWTAETTRQFDLAVRAAAALAAVYHAARFAVVVEGTVDPAALHAALAEVGLGGVLTGVVLHPSVAAARERNRAREGKDFDTGVLEGTIGRLDADLRAGALPDGWHRLDTSSQSVQETVEAVLDLLPLDARPGPPR